ncbi:MAG: cytochrome b N-terminal domain-containing protein [Candidatus Latescibacterota bacterium]|nr:MAG: cytochrome b N-terminal domain-containing protein [Candidatus Latescibacterota bacterium]
MPKENQSNPSSSLPSRVWRSIFRGPIFPRDDRDRKKIVFDTLVLHFRPIRVREDTIRYSHTWGLGGSSFILFLILVSTGVLLMFVYQPSPDGAYESVVSLEHDVFFGKLIRNMHHWSANFLIAFLILHLLRVYFTGGYHAPRQFNWVIGLLLLGCVLLSNFTGYLLPWDQLSYWATTIVTGMIGYVPVVGGWLQGVIRGGESISGKTLVIFYAAHTTVIPVLIIVLAAFHFWRVRKARGVVVPRLADDPEPRSESGPAQKPNYVLTLPNLILREFSVALALIAFVMVVALIFNAGLGEPANPGMSPNPAKAPWYFVGFQELLLHFDPLFAVLVIPLLAAIGLVSIPYFDYDRDTSGIFMMSHEGRRLGAMAAVVAVVATVAWVIADEFVIDLAAWMPPVIANGLVPAVVLFGVLAGFYRWAKKRGGSSNNEAIQTLFILLAMGFAVLTVVGVWFRGEGMALVWPWNF